MNAYFYHGTTADVVARIKKQGLRPEMERAYKFLNDYQALGILAGYPEMNNTADRTRDGDVFLTASREAAELFAAFRSAYETMPPGLLRFGFNHIIKQPDEFVRKGKPAEPVVLELAIPRELAEMVVPDERADHNLAGYRLKANIPPKYIEHIFPVSTGTMKMRMEGSTYDLKKASSENEEAA